MYALTDAISELLEVPIVERGVNAMLRCPFHEDRKPSFSINLEEGLWYCFGCEERGNLKTLYRKLDREIGHEVRMAWAKKRAEEPADIFGHDFTPLANAYVRELGHPSCFIADYRESRGISEAAIERFAVGYDPHRDALSFPYTDTEDRVTGIKYRYRNGFKASEGGSVYGVYGLDAVVGRTDVILCEGESDTLSTYSRYGESFGVGGTSGASLSEAQWTRISVHFIFAKTIYLVYDGDEAGHKASATAMRVLGDRSRSLELPDGYDASEFYLGGGRLEDLGLNG